MCQIWRKEYTCGCISHPYRDRCTSCLKSKDDKCDNMDWVTACRKSFFACYDCLVEQDRGEKEAAIASASGSASASASRRAEQRNNEFEALKREAERERQAKIRREAEARAAREREEERVREERLRQEREMSRKEGGMWAEVAGGKRGKKVKTAVSIGGGAANGGAPARSGIAASNPFVNLPAPAPPTTMTFSPGQITLVTREKDIAVPKVIGDSPKNGNGSGSGKTEQRKGKGNNSPISNRNGNGASGSSPLHRTTGSITKIDDGKSTDKGNGLPEKPNGLPEKPDFGDNKKGVDPGGRAGTWGPKKSGTKLEKSAVLRKGVV